jgi:hypothetical protein
MSVALHESARAYHDGLLTLQDVLRAYQTALMSALTTLDGHCVGAIAYLLQQGRWNEGAAKAVVTEPILFVMRMITTGTGTAYWLDDALSQLESARGTFQVALLLREEEKGTESGAREKAPAGSPPKGTFEEESLPAALSATELAKRLNAKYGKVESFLRRYRKKYPDCYVEAEGRRRTTAQYLYRVAEVWPVLQQRYGVRRATDDGRATDENFS